MKNPIVMVESAENGRFDMNDNIIVNTDFGELHIPEFQCLEILRTLFDKHNKPYDVLDEIEDEIIGDELDELDDIDDELEMADLVYEQNLNRRFEYGGN